LLAALVLLALALEWRRAPERVGWLWAMVVIVPIALAVSHPSAFVAGGLSLGLIGPVYRARRRGVWVPFLLFQLTMAGSFLLLFLLFTELQGRWALAGLRSYWASSFPPLDRPGKLLGWLVEVHTGAMFAYPGGGRNGASLLTTLAVLAASVLLWRRRRRGMLAILLTPFALALAASVVRRYPYGGSARQMQFLAPSICILAGLGAAWFLRAFSWPIVRRGVISLVLVLLAGAGLVAMATDLARPYRFLYDQQAREFARQFWPSQAREAELACLRWEFGIVNRRSMNLRTAVFLCNQKIYSPQRRNGNGPRWQEVSSTRPLRCVLYNETPPDHPDVVSWLARMRTNYTLRRTETLTVNADGSSEGPKQERIVVFEFVLGADPQVASSAASSTLVK
jgi:hypothetical protein